MGEKILVTISDSLALYSGFSRVIRELVPVFKKYRHFHVGYGKGFFGSDVVQYTEYRENRRVIYGQEILAEMILGGFDNLVIFSLLDPWCIEWLVHENSVVSNPVFNFAKKKASITWIGYFPIDAKAVRGYPVHLFDVISKADVPIFMSDFGVRTTGMLARVVFHGCSVKNFGWKREERINWLNSLGKLEFKPDDKIVLVVAANRRRKYWPLMLSAFSNLRQEDSSFRLIGIYGGDGDWDLVSLCESCGLEYYSGDNPKAPVWLLRFVSDQILEAFYNSCDVVWLLSGGEGFGLPQLEAHGAGKPCVVGAYSASAELAVDGKELVRPRGFYSEEPFGLLRPVYDPDDVVRATCSVLARSDEIREEALKFAGEYTWDRARFEFDQILSEVMK